MFSLMLFIQLILSIIIYLQLKKYSKMETRYKRWVSDLEDQIEEYRDEVNEWYKETYPKEYYGDKDGSIE